MCILYSNTNCFINICNSSWFIEESLLYGMSLSFTIMIISLFSSIFHSARLKVWNANIMWVKVFLCFYSGTVYTLLLQYQGTSLLCSCRCWSTECRSGICWFICVCHRNVWFGILFVFHVSFQPAWLLFHSKNVSMRLVMSRAHSVCVMGMSPVIRSCLAICVSKALKATWCCC